MDETPEAAKPAVRSSDADRERVAGVLRTAFAQGRIGKDELDERLAAAYAAGTGAELAVVTRDLQVTATPTATKGTGIIAGFRRTGRWTVGRAFRGLAVIGSGEIDLRDAEFAEGETTINATAIISTITVVVPVDAEVHVGGTGVIGGFGHGGEGPGTPGGPKITITGLALCGNVRVERR
ncbi:DUF1707 domain-containing protein [Actinomadura sp. DC4]|uniref:DUF1707 SHOCT-like domain-containing protein n=1 Tax=Actinomadura sp. DC4 TaxID=3055069 RepID=UPI0025B0AA4B|nr:DUF1707 domain-containing protein [Actinomadura sp. DC4]MDN3357400.1 DUF1707 domain-containing protein [Actinomadura sp. DC4]